MVVVLPAPFAPTKPVIRPAVTVNDTSRSTWRLPKLRLTWSTSRTFMSSTLGGPGGRHVRPRDDHRGPPRGGPGWTTPSS
jgi:hypothetical protein